MSVEVSGAGMLAALAAGVISFLSPCVLPLVPAYISYIAGESLTGLWFAERLSGPALQQVTMAMQAVIA